MNIKKAEVNQLAVIKGITDQTIKVIYPNYYSNGAVKFFLDHHKESNILNDIKKGNVYLIENNENVVGTVTMKGNEVFRLFVLPQYQGKGLGQMLMDFAERRIAEYYNEILLDASLPAKKFYLKRGYCETESKSIPLENGDFLCYDVMRKCFLC